jgi:adenylate kinase
MRLIFLGAPGSGKGTQAKRLAKKYGCEHISSGDLLRQAIRDRTPLGLKAQHFMNAGELVPDDVVLGMIKEELTKTHRCFIFDGFPRTGAQAEGLDKILDELGMRISMVISLEVSDALIIERLAFRRLCSKCGHEYNLKTRLPKSENICDFCNGELQQRHDDDADIVKNRLLVYHEKTKPIEDFYRSRGLLVEIDGSKNIDDVFDAITKVVDNGK